MNKRIKVFILCVILLGFVGFSEAAKCKRDEEPSVRFLPSGSFYIYGMGSANYYDPSWNYSHELDSDTDVDIAPLVGVGYRMLNVQNHFYLNLEFDYIPAEYKFDFGKESIQYYTLMLSSEIKPFSRNGFSCFLGIGGGVLSNDDENVNLAVSLGIKCPLSKNILLRAEARAYGDLSDDDDDRYYLHREDWHYDDEEDDFACTSTAVAVGLEIHF